MQRIPLRDNQQMVVVGYKAVCQQRKRIIGEEMAESAFQFEHLLFHPEARRPVVAMHDFYGNRNQRYVAQDEDLGDIRIDEEITEETVQSFSEDTLLFLPIPDHADDMMATFFLEQKQRKFINYN